MAHGPIHFHDIFYIYGHILDLHIAFSEHKKKTLAWQIHPKLALAFFGTVKTYMPTSETPHIWKGSKQNRDRKYEYEREM